MLRSMMKWVSASAVILGASAVFAKEAGISAKVIRQFDGMNKACEGEFNRVGVDRAYIIDRAVVKDLGPKFKLSFKILNIACKKNENGEYIFDFHAPEEASVYTLPEDGVWSTYMLRVLEQQVYLFNESRVVGQSQVEDLSRTVTSVELEIPKVDVKFVPSQDNKTESAGLEVSLQSYFELLSSQSEPLQTWRSFGGSYLIQFSKSR